MWLPKIRRRSIATTQTIRYRYFLLEIHDFVAHHCILQWATRPCQLIIYFNFVIVLVVFWKNWYFSHIASIVIWFQVQVFTSTVGTRTSLLLICRVSNTALPQEKWQAMVLWQSELMLGRNSCEPNLTQSTRRGRRHYNTFAAITIPPRTPTRCTDLAENIKSREELNFSKWHEDGIGHFHQINFDRPRVGDTKCADSECIFFFLPHQFFHFLCFFSWLFFEAYFGIALK